jgi:hypothetical protein
LLALKPKRHFRPYALSQRREVVLDDRRDHFEVDLEIAVDHSVAEAGNTIPRDLRMLLLESRRQALGRLGERLESVDGGITEVDIGVERSPTLNCRGMLDSVGSFIDVS